MTKETRIDRRFAALKAEGRPALVTFVTAGDPDSRPRRRSCSACPKPAPTSSSSACPSPIRWPTAPRSRPPRCARSSPARPCSKTLELVRAFRKTRQRHADRADGLLQPHLRLPARALPRRCQGGRRRWPDHRRPAARGRRRTVPAGDRSAGSTSSASPRRPPTPSACRRCCATPRASSTTCRSPALPAPPRPTVTAVHATSHGLKKRQPSRGGRFWRKPPSRPGAGRGCRRRRGRLGPGWRIEKSLGDDGRSTSKTVPAVLILLLPATCCAAGEQRTN